MQGTEKHKLRAVAGERVQRLGVGKAEGFIPCDCDAAAEGGGRFGHRRCGGRTVKDPQQPRHIHMRLKRLGKRREARVQIINFPRGQKAEMAALHARIVQPGQAAQYRDARLPLQRGGECGAERGGARVEHDGRKPAPLPEIPQPAHRRREGETRPLRGQHQQHGEIQRLRHMPGARARTYAAESVVIAHGPLDHGRAVVLAGPLKERPDLRLVAQKEIEIIALHPERRPVEHGIDVVRPALKSTGRKSAPGERL